MDRYHRSVLLHETIDTLNVQSGEKYIDGTLGGGGHAFRILEKGGIVLGIDMDQDALDFSEKDLRLRIKDLKIGTDIILAKGNFRDINSIAKEKGFERVAGIILDIGISSHHVDIGERGFSFMKKGPLDMRMDQEQKIQAKDLINTLTKGELYELFTKLGEERFSRSIITSILAIRKTKRIETTTELADIIKRAVPFSKKGIHPATRVFQALRIAVNDELRNLIECLPKAVALLKPSGRLVVISFHSLEDRIVKRSFLEFEEKGLGRIITKKPITPSDEEIENNSRARSSKLRVFERA